VAIVRGVLFLVLTVIGGYIGYYVGSWYTQLPPILKYIGDNPNLMRASQAGFAVIGVLLGLYGFTKVSAYIEHLAENLREMPANDKIALCMGAIVGLVLAVLIHPILNQIEEPIPRILLTVALALVLVFLTTQGALGMREELRKLLPPYGAVAGQDEKALLKQAKLLDTNIIIDGRIHDICRTGFIEGTIYVPGFVLDELQLIADSGDGLKRARGRRGLDILNAMQKEFSLVVRTYDHMVSREDHEGVDSKLVRLAKAMESTIVTNDFNLNKVAELQGVKVLNVNELANALKPVVLPGEELSVHVIKEGKEPGQGIAYLDDGTMVVVENARRHVGETVDVVVASVLQTVAGKMIFGQLRDVADEEEDLMDRNLRSYYRGGRRGGRTH
jgi:uncharacterized protein YacL